MFHFNSLYLQSQLMGSLYTQNLKDYLNDSENNDTIIPLFTQAFEDYKKGVRVTIAQTLCEMVKQYVSKDVKEIKL